MWQNVEQVYRDMSVEFESYPSDATISDPHAYIKAMDTLKKGDLVFIFTPGTTTLITRRD